jgi:hypothetical protein
MRLRFRHFDASDRPPVRLATHDCTCRIKDEDRVLLGSRERVPLRIPNSNSAAGREGTASARDARRAAEAIAAVNRKAQDFWGNQ